jgi:hypothetical protein
MRLGIRKEERGRGLNFKAGSPWLNVETGRLRIKNKSLEFITIQPTEPIKQI